MRYMFLIYSREDEAAPPEELEAVAGAHMAVMDAAKQRGIFHGAEPLASSLTATTIRSEHGKIVVTDGPFAETKEQLAGYYILDCKDLDDAIAWAAKIPTACRGAAGCVEIRPFRERPAPPAVHG